MAKPDLVYVTASPAGNLFAETGLSSTHESITVSGAGSGVSTFLALTDTPNDYSESSDQYVKVDRDGLVLEFGTLATANLTDWSPFANQILFVDGDGQVTSRPDRSLAMQLSETVTLNSSTPTAVSATNGFAVKLLVSDGTGNPNLASLEQVGGKPGTRVILWYETESVVGDTVEITSDAQLAIITISGTTGLRVVNNIDSIVLNSVSSWAMLESRILEWHLIDYSGATINMA